MAMSSESDSDLIVIFKYKGIIMFLTFIAILEIAERMFASFLVLEKS